MTKTQSGTILTPAELVQMWDEYHQNVATHTGFTSSITALDPAHQYQMMRLMMQALSAMSKQPPKPGALEEIIKMASLMINAVKGLAENKTLSL